MTEFKDYMIALASDTSPDGSADYVVSYDTSGSAAKKVLINNLPFTTSGSSTSGLLGLTRYAPGTLTVYSTSASSLADVDATNMKVTFTAPSSGNIIVRMSAYADVTVAADYFWSLREGSSDLSGTVARILRQINTEVYIHYTAYLTGVSAGSHTYKWAAAASTGGTGRIVIQNGIGATSWAPAIMEVWSA